MKIECQGCFKTPNELEEYAELADDAGLTPDEFVMYEEGTYNRENGHFLCTPCYVRAGMPTAPGNGWKCP